GCCSLAVPQCAPPSCGRRAGPQPPDPSRLQSVRLRMLHSPFGGVARSYHRRKRLAQMQTILAARRYAFRRTQMNNYGPYGNPPQAWGGDAQPQPQSGQPQGWPGQQPQGWHGEQPQYGSTPYNTQTIQGSGYAGYPPQPPQG